MFFSLSFYTCDNNVQKARIQENNDYAYEIDAPSRTLDMWDNSESLNYGQFCRLMEDANPDQTRLEAKLYNQSNNFGNDHKGSNYNLSKKGYFGGNLFVNWFTDSSNARTLNYISGDQLYVESNDNASQFYTPHPYVEPNMGWSSSNQSAPYTHSGNPWSYFVSGRTSCVGCIASGNGYNTLPYGQTSILNDMSHSFGEGIPHVPYGWSNCTATGNCDYHNSGYGVWLFWVK